MKLNPLEHPICLAMPEWLEETAWAGHLPFAMFLISALRPRVFVELGVDRGTSYCTFCQAVKTLGTGTKTFGVDTWQGDEHAGKRSEEVYSKLREHHDLRYSSFSKLVRSTFDEALPTFADGSVDLLHIDGFHTYDAVRHDFETWLPKMSDRGIVLFHDTIVHDRDFGVWKFFKEVSKSRPSFEFQHS
ncbi:MAG TPA: class I SAM-dependent methyltransferase, partial [Pyrinomonadaceae bacterium]|nr:class I SAM-dependent methyltransferase [Pyrinomonadaceae bacterium]